jgi:prophage antirepressor-like protein
MRLLETTGTSLEYQMSNLCLLDFNGFSISAIVNDDRSIIIPAKDICDPLGLEDVSAACRSLDDDEKFLRPVIGGTGSRDVLHVSESGMYQLIFQSRKPEAKAFRKWVTSIVLPSIRATGTYKSPKAIQLENWLLARDRSKLISLFFTAECKRYNYNAGNIHNRITTAITGMTAKELSEHCDLVDGRTAIGLNHITDIERLNRVTEVKKAFASATTQESQDERLDRIFKKFGITE